MITFAHGCFIYSHQNNQIGLTPANGISYFSEVSDFYRTPIIVIHKILSYLLIICLSCFFSKNNFKSIYQLKTLYACVEKAYMS